jgi:hypothetical protein
MQIRAARRGVSDFIRHADRIDLARDAAGIFRPADGFYKGKIDA